MIPLPSSSDKLNPTQAIVTDLLASAARQGELGIAWGRLILGIAVTLIWPIVHWNNLLALVPRVVAAFALGVLALIWTLYVFYRLRNANPSRALTYTSIAIDAVLINSLVMMYVIAPGASHQSIVEVHSTAFVYIAIVSAGVRFSRAAAYFGAAINSVMLIALVATSTIRVDNLRIIGGAEWLTVGIGLIGSTVLAVRIATRTGRLVAQAAEETQRSETARSKLGAYISPEVADKVLKESELRLGGERQNVAVLFSDLRGFTTYSESLEPEEIVEQLNDYMSVMVDTITQHGGIVDKFIGDGIMAVFGAPIPKPDDADRAVECAQDMMRAIDKHNQERKSKGLSKLKHGIGVHYGPVVAGNVGTPARAAYTVIGDTVNLASRLESMTKQVEADLIVSDEALQNCTRAHGIARIDEIHVPGRSGAVTIHGT
ncbi:adenylate/guanylate cyclase domain-containing protein [Bythopirellula polymerisocia]|uniref:Adenylate cyclase 1 n=1 Tax=Bythopirellula polymerisocia TaxID=2528003 RepID=A0A5C6CIX0_9BACT|nr:adenylate/guanylate cyclase domain-containing protein [Bythopirellula polymerisocia]TWU24733.1 Adenylate cyclase 1 [Bythopirellula polymerisocia]